MTDSSLRIQDQEPISWLYDPVFIAPWPKAILIELASWTNGMAFRNIDFSSSGRPVIKIAEIKDGVTGQTKFTNATYESCYFVSAGCMLLSWSGQPETSIDVYWWRGPDGWLNQHVFKVQARNDIDQSFLYYLLRYLKPNFIGIARNKQTTGLGHVTRKDLERIRVAVPLLSEQRAIAHILGTLDDKIELNRQMNQTMEAMAQALFKSWFVDFEPFRDQGMQDSPMEEIPMGWRVGKIADVAELNKKSINPGNFTSEYFYHFSIPAYDEGQMPKTEKGMDIKSNKFEVAMNAVLISKLNPRFPRVWLPFVDSPRHSICSTEFLVVTPKGNMAREYLYSLFSSHSFRETFETFITGTSSSHQRVKPDDLMAIDAVIPPEKVTTNFSDTVRPLLILINLNLVQNATLSVIRDALLPKLLSGEIRVKDAEKFVGEAV